MSEMDEKKVISLTGGRKASPVPESAGEAATTLGPGPYTHLTLPTLDAV